MIVTYVIHQRDIHHGTKDPITNPFSRMLLLQSLNKILIELTGLHNIESTIVGLLLETLLANLSAYLCRGHC